MEAVQQQQLARLHDLPASPTVHRARAHGAVDNQISSLLDIKRSFGSQGKRKRLRKLSLQPNSSLIADEETQESDEITTPKAKECSIREAFICPPAPRKSKSKAIRRSSPPGGFFSPPDLELFLSPQI